MIKPIYLLGSQVLRDVAKEVDICDKAAVESLIQDLRDTLKVSDGVGLAAPQIGVSLRAVIVNGDDLKETYDYLAGFERVIINPVVLEEGEKICEYEEGCLSVPGVYSTVRRPSTITLEYYNEKLEKVTETFTGFACRMVQHELDHLDGVVFVDRVAPVRKKIIAKKIQNIMRGKVATRYKSKIQ